MKQLDTKINTTNMLGRGENIERLISFLLIQCSFDAHFLLSFY